MHEHWTSEELEKYRQVIKRAPGSRAREDVRRRRKLDKLFDRLHGADHPNTATSGMEGNYERDN